MYFYSLEIENRSRSKIFPQYPQMNQLYSIQTCGFEISFFNWKNILKKSVARITLQRLEVKGYRFQYYVLKFPYFQYLNDLVILLSQRQKIKFVT